MQSSKNIALVAHDNRKHTLIKWVEWNREMLINHNLIATCMTGGLVEKALIGKKEENEESISVLKLKSSHWVETNSWDR